ncbi:leucine-rich PPR motif-containing protein, mitochondrial isoform X3 [Procambarus clarkii]|uniref:leucine-rich PPR motif-containing protein, mitochondrial isoform X3 n=1 Tax=Procambarus clarkii TaxID=6728 RepID=UPI00374321C5
MASRYGFVHTRNLLKSVKSGWLDVYPSQKFSKYVQYGSRSNGNIAYSSRLGQSFKKSEYNCLLHTSVTSEVLDDYFLEHDANGLNMQGTLRILLLLNATQNDSKSVLSLLKKAKINGVKPSADTVTSIIMAYIRNKNIDAAVNMYSTLQVDYPSYTLDHCKILDLGTLLIENGRTQEAVQMLKGHLQSEVKESFDMNLIRGNCKNLLIASAATCDYELTKQLFNMLLSGGLVKPDNFIVVTLLQCKLNSGDLSGAIDVIEDLYESYNLLPRRVEMLILIIRHLQNSNQNIELPNFVCSDSEQSVPASGLLERMFNLIVQRNNYRLAQHDLMFACLETGQPDEAKQILQNLGEEADVNLLNKMCKLYSKMELEDPLLHLLNISKGNDAVDRHKVFAALLHIYNVQNAAEKGLALHASMQEENLLPSKPFLSTLALLLTNNNIKIPLHI